MAAVAPRKEDAVEIRRRVTKDVACGGNVSPGWRMAWYEPRRRIGVYAPVPFHWVLRFAREFKYRLRWALAAPAIEETESLEMERRQQERERLADEYSRGYLNGWGECFDACVSAIEEECDRTKEVWRFGEFLQASSTDQQN